MRLLSILLPALWAALFVAMPLLLVAAISLSQSRLGQPPFTPLFEAGRFMGSLENYALLLSDPLYLDALLNSLLYAGLGTMLALAIGLCIARAVANAGPRWQLPLLAMIIVPFWISFLIRIYAWILLLKPEGLINGALQGLGVIDAPLPLLNTGFAVVLGIAYAYLPFMILPIHAALQDQPPALAEAAIDLGASPAKAFWLVTLPLAWPGIAAGCLLVFIPAMGEFIIPDLLGGSATPMLGQALWNEFFLNRDWPLACALAVLLGLLLLLPALLLQRGRMRESTV